MSRVQAPARTGRGTSNSALQRAFPAGIALVVFVLAVVAAHWRPLWYDEIFTLYVAQSPSLAATVSPLLAGADTSPPLDCVLRHLSVAASASVFPAATLAVFYAYEGRAHALLTGPWVSVSSRIIYSLRFRPALVNALFAWRSAPGIAGQR